MNLLEISIVNEQESLRSLQKVISVQQYEQALDDAAALLLDHIRKRFLAQTAPDGTKWPESLAAKKRREQGRDGGTLYDTGRLFHSIQAVKVGQFSRSIETDVPYAPKHQLGLDGMVRRVFIGANQEDIDAMTLVVFHKLLGGLNEQ